MLRVIAGTFAAALLATSALAAPAGPAPLAELVKAVEIPHADFTLPNGLRVIVSPDHKAPVVAVSIWYHVGSRFEPAGKTGFAHLFEHLMFNGSENANDDYFVPMENVGATDLNGTTWFDRTNYFETVPTGALDLALFLESDRMGHLVGAIDQAKLDNQRGVVKNEKRQGDNQPYGLVEYAQLTALFPAGHPYHHPTIGSMADLDGASLADVKGWFHDHYGPNNAVLVLAGDIDVATAKDKVTRWFGGIPAGPKNADVDAPVTSLPKDVEQLMHDRVAAVRLYRNWVVPGINDPDAINLDIAMSVLGGLSSSRLDNALVRQEKSAVAVSANIQQFEKIGLAEVSVDVKPGADPIAVGKRLDALIADYLKTGPSADEVSRAATKQVAGTISGLEQVGGFGGKAVTLAEGAVYSDDPDKYRKDLAGYAAATPAEVTAAARKWLGRPVFRLTVAPGDRSAGDNAAAGNATMHPNYYRDPAQGGAPAPATPAPAKPGIVAPPVSPIADLTFPAVERATLSNGIKIVFARRATVPVVRVTLSFDAGNAADRKDKLGTSQLMLSLLDEGTTTRDSIQIAEAEERLGATIGAAAGIDNTDISLFALKPNLGASLDLLADIVRNPAFALPEVERLRASLLTRIASEKTEPTGIALRELPPLIYGPAHPYGVPFSGTGTPAGVAAVTQADLFAFHDTWIRPDNATIFAVGDTSLAELVPLLEARFGKWQAPAAAKGVKLFRMDKMARPSRIVLIDRPQSPQSVILAGALLPVKGTDDPQTLVTANEILGGSFTSRLNMDLRESKGWAYGVGTQARMVKQEMPFFLYAPVQADKTGPSIVALLADMRSFLTTQGVTPAERDRIVNSQIRSLPGSFETSSDLLGGIERNATYGRPDDYYTGLAARYRAMTSAELDKAARAAIDPSTLIWVVVGDAKIIQPQLVAIGLPVELKTAE